MCDPLTSDIVSVGAPWGVVLLIVNIFFPGIGTIINALMGSKCHVTIFIVGVLQLLFAGFIIGWIWSIWWGVLIFQKQR